MWYGTHTTRELHVFNKGDDLETITEHLKSKFYIGYLHHLNHKILESGSIYISRFNPDKVAVEIVELDETKLIRGHNET